MVLRRLVAASLLTFGLGLGWGVAFAQVYPDRLIKVIVPFVPGSPVDAAARAITQHIQTRLGQNMVIENKPGGGTTIGLKAVMAAPTDGYTLLFIGPNLVYTPVLYPSMNFDPFKSLAPVASVVSYSHVMVVAPAVPAKTVKELVAHIKANPGKVTFASQGAGSTSHLSANLIDLLAGTEMVHVPYRGAVPALNAVMAGQIDLFFDTVTTSVPQHRAGNVRIMAVGSTERSAIVPEAPPVSDTLPGFRSVTWFAMAGPPGMAPELAAKINQDVNESLARPEMSERLRNLSLEPMLGTPADATKFFAEETALWGRVIKEKNITVQ
jgi:tripartite-type tricarboxylate transporter receptor subunit TctC